MLLAVSILLLLVVEGCEGKIGVEGKSSKTQRKCWKNAAEPKVRACTGYTRPTNHQCSQSSEELSTREGHDVNGLDFECMRPLVDLVPPMPRGENRGQPNHKRWCCCGGNLVCRLM